MPIIKTGSVSTNQLSTQQKTKRAVSGYIDTNSVTVPVCISALMYNSTAIIVKKIGVYVVDEIQGINFVLDVGIDGTDNAILDGEAIGTSVTADVDYAFDPDTAAVASGHVITASTKTQDGTGGTIQVSIEYEEVDT